MIYWTAFHGHIMLQIQIRRCCRWRHVRTRLRQMIPRSLSRFLTVCRHTIHGYLSLNVMWIQPSQIWHADGVDGCNCPDVTRGLPERGLSANVPVTPTRRMRRTIVERETLKRLATCSCVRTHSSMAKTRALSSIFSFAIIRNWMIVRKSLKYGCVSTNTCTSVKFNR